MNRVLPLFIVGMALFASLCPQSFVLGEYVRTRGEQCKADGFVSGACFNGRPNPKGIQFEETCDRLVCAESISEQVMGHTNHVPVWGKVPDDGTYAGRNHICSKGARVAVAKEDMPLTGNKHIDSVRCKPREPKQRGENKKNTKTGTRGVRKH